MAHVRTQIRNAVVACLANLPMTGSRVYPGRALPVDPERIAGPALLVYCGDEPEISRTTIGQPATEAHQLLLHVNGVAKASVNLEDVLDQIALEVQKAIDPLLIGGNGCELKAIKAGIDETLEKPCGVITLTYQIEYYTRSDQPDVLM